MNNYYEMTSKRGFDDGENIPAEAWELRKLYVEVINLLAEKYGSHVRAIAFDRGGVHNPCMIVFHVLGNVDLQIEEDEQMLRAIDEALELGVDDFIEVKIERSADIGKLWAALEGDHAANMGS